MNDEFLTTPDTGYYTRLLAFSPLEDRNTAYVHIQKEIQALEAAIRALKGRHNSLSPISRHPAELLSRIFELLAHSEDSRPFQRRTHWVGVSHVCSQWRHIALECLRLWSHITCFPYSRWAMEMLKRSKMAPLTVEGRAGWGPIASAQDKVVTAALEQLSRIEHLTLTLHGLPKLKDIFSCLSGAAPLLHTFQVTSDDPQTILPENIFSGPGGAPQLHCLSLDRCTVNWKSELLRSLTHLTVARVSTDELITNLDNLPQLESIHLSLVMVPLGPSDASSSLPIHLPLYPTYLS